MILWTTNEIVIGKVSQFFRKLRLATSLLARFTDEGFDGTGRQSHLPFGEVWRGVASRCSLISQRAARLAVPCFKLFMREIIPECRCAKPQQPSDTYELDVAPTPTCVSFDLGAAEANQAANPLIVVSLNEVFH